VFPLPPGDTASFVARAEALQNRRGLSESVALTLADFNRELGAGEQSVKNLGRLTRGDALGIAARSAPHASGRPVSILFKASTAVALARSLEERGIGGFVPVFTIDGGDPAVKAGSPGASDPRHAVDLGRALHRLLPGWGLVVCALRLLRPEGLPVFEQEFLGPDWIRAMLAERGADLRARGLEAPFQETHPTNLHFETDSGAVSHVAWDGARFTLEGEEVEPFDLLSRLERLVPGPALQPLLLEMALPVASQVADPPEAASFAQALPLYSCFGLPDPLVFPAAAGSLLIGEDRREETDWVRALETGTPNLADRLLASIDVFDFRHRVYSW